MTKRKLDWQPNWDPRNDNFLLAGLDCYVNGSERDNILRRKRVWLDQGREGACTGFGTSHVLAATPKPKAGIVPAIAFSLYYEARRQDEWAGEDYDGSSINGVMRAARLLGHISGWRWCRTLPEVRHGLSYHGPLVIGVNWYTGMFEPDNNGILSVSGTIAGGHALMLAGYESFGGYRYYRLENSWGPDWGDDGGCWINEPHLHRLLNERGEFALPKKTV